MLMIFPCVSGHVCECVCFLCMLYTGWIQSGCVCHTLCSSAGMNEGLRFTLRSFQELQPTACPLKCTHTQHEHSCCITVSRPDKHTRDPLPSLPQPLYAPKEKRKALSPLQSIPSSDPNSSSTSIPGIPQLAFCGQPPPELHPHPPTIAPSAARQPAHKASFCRRCDSQRWPTASVKRGSPNIVTARTKNMFTGQLHIL